MHTFSVFGAAFAGLGVAAGAFGAHALSKRLDERALDVFETGVRYQMYHALALLFVGMIATQSVQAKWAGWAFVVGIIIFSGTLYAIALGGPKKLGMVTPVGGTLMIVGWVLLAIAAVKLSR